jgi:hypothetical protein
MSILISHVSVLDSPINMDYKWIKYLQYMNLMIYFD